MQDNLGQMKIIPPGLTQPSQILPRKVSRDD
jgi:hypothetical protein